MTLIKTSLLNGIAVVIKILTLLGINKILAVYVGPAGYAAIGQLQNAMQLITTIASGAVSTGVTKYTAEYSDDEVKQHGVWSAATSIMLWSTLVVSVAVFFLSPLIAQELLGNVDYSVVLQIFSVSLIFFVANGLVLSILNGKKEVKLYVMANIAGSFISLMLVAILTVTSGLFGALVSLALYQSISFIATVKFCFGLKWFKISNFFGKVDRVNVLNLLKYALMAITSAVCVPLSHMMVRGYLSDNFGVEAAGYWEALWRMSSSYLLVVTTTLSLYYLPKLSELKRFIDIKKEVVSGYKLILPVTAFCGVIVYLLRDIIVVILFSSEFLPARELFGWQMVGDTLKIGSWLLAYVMVSKAMFKTFIVTEILAAGSFVFFTMFLTTIYGVKGVAMAHAVTYLFYWAIVSVAVYCFYKSKKFRLSDADE